MREFYKRNNVNEVSWEETSSYLTQIASYLHLKKIKVKRNMSGIPPFATMDQKGCK